MISFSRRQLAHYAVEEMLSNRRPGALAERLAAALIASDRQKEVEQLLLDIDQELEGRGLLARAYVTAARRLSTELKDDLSAALKKAAGVKQVDLIEHIDQDIIGGIRIETAIRSWDKTLKRTLSQIKEAV